jgi:hypothetical protein
LRVSSYAQTPARNRRGFLFPKTPNPPVGASSLAKVVNDNAGILNKRGALKFFASKLAPTGFFVRPPEIVENNIPKLPNRDIKPLQSVVLSRF